MSLEWWSGVNSLSAVVLLLWSVTDYRKGRYVWAVVDAVFCVWAYVAAVLLYVK